MDHLTVELYIRYEIERVLIDYSLNQNTFFGARCALWEVSEAHPRDLVVEAEVFLALSHITIQESRRRPGLPEALPVAAATLEAGRASVGSGSAGGWGEDTECL